MQLIVDKAQRFAKMRAHTATHLLHAEIEKILHTTKQAWSFVDEDIARFDFQTDRLLNLEELNQIEKNINLIIYKALPVEKKEMSFDEAIKLGAKAFFEDKYWDVVRVVTVKDWNMEDGKMEDEGHFISIELCGGTHIGNTKDIGCFKIIAQEAVASWVKRLTLITGPKVYEYLNDQEKLIWNLAAKLDCQPKQVQEKLDKMLKEYEDWKSKIESLEIYYLAKALPYNKQIEISEDDTVLNNVIDFKTIINWVRNNNPSKDWILIKHDWSFAICNWSWTKSAKDIAKDLWLKWGGSDVLVQGKDPKVLELLSKE